MKKSNLLRLVLTVTLFVMVACTPKDKPRQVHEGKREWTPVQTPDDPSVQAKEFDSFDMKKSYEALKSNDPQIQMKGILQPLSAFVLNQSIVGTPRFRTSKLTQMLHVFHRAFLAALLRKDQTTEFLEIKSRYYRTVFAGCSADLRRDCANASLFADIPGFRRIMTAFAEELDPIIDAEFTKFKSSSVLCVEESELCRSTIEKRYRFLSMANLQKSNTKDPNFSFAYLKYARIFATLINFDKALRDPLNKRTVGLKNNNPELANESRQLGYVAAEHSKIFESIIPRYTPKSMNDPEFVAFVKIFNPWGYSQKKVDDFQGGTPTMFKFATECCLYTDSKKIEIAKEVKDAIIESQAFLKEAEDFEYEDKPENAGKSVTFQQKVRRIQKLFGNTLFEKLGMKDDISLIENFNSEFYNEFFLVADRLFNGELDSQIIDMVLSKASPARAEKYLPKVISTYIKVNLIYLVIKTNRYMKKIYTSDQIASDLVFKEATTKSRVLTFEWDYVQKKAELLNSVMGSYFKGRNLYSPAFIDTDKLILSINRNIHYISVFPNMIVMNYFLAKMNGEVKFNTWWGEISFSADTILDTFFDGKWPNPWFKFGRDSIALDRQMLLYAWDYMLSTGSLQGINHEKFYELIFTKYVDSNLAELRKKINELDRNVFGHFSYSAIEKICDYEMEHRGLPPPIDINFLHIGRYTYSGLGGNGVNVLMKSLLGDAAKAVAYYRDETDKRLTFLRAMIDLIEFDLRLSGKTPDPKEGYAETKSARAVLDEFEKLKLSLAQTFMRPVKVGDVTMPLHRRLFECTLKIQDVERRRANRLYAEERAHLAKVFEEMRPLAEIKDKAVLDRRVAEINARLFKGPDSHSRFDYIQGLTYRRSKYDLLMRMKRRIEDDIFVNLTPEESQNYSKEENLDYARHRKVNVYKPEGLERDPMVSDMTANNLTINGGSDEDKKVFIRDGMAALNGKTGSYIEWQGQRADDTSLTDYIESLIEFYLLGPVTDDNKVKYEVTAAELATAYTEVYASYTLDALDLQASMEFKDDGRFTRTFYVDRFIEGNGAPLPFFFDLMVRVKGRAGLNVEGEPQGSTAALDGFAFAQTLNNLEGLIFTPSPALRKSVIKHFGDRVNTAFKRTRNLFDHLLALEKNNSNVASLHPHLTRPFLLQDGNPVEWAVYNPGLVDEVKNRDLNIKIEDFERNTNNIYETREAVKVH